MVDCGHKLLDLTERVGLSTEEMHADEPRVVVHDDEHVLIAPDGRPLERSDDVSMDQASHVAWLVPFALVWKAGGVCLRAGCTRVDSSFLEVVGRVSCEGWKVPNELLAHVQATMHGVHSSVGREGGQV